jgi:mono/diheme cytochrome c family protein
MKRILILTIVCAVLAACGGENKSTESAGTPAAQSASTGNPSYDPNRGSGKFTHVDVAATLSEAMADNGKKVFDVKCSACHKLTEEKLVGPGWKGVTGRHTAEWIMNFVTNTDEMISKDPKAQAMLELCLVRMPNQNLSDDDARNVYEYMRKNDGVK